MIAMVTVGSAVIGVTRGGLGGRGRFTAVAWSLVAENGLRCVLVSALLLADVRNPVAHGLCLVAGQLVVVLWPSALRYAGSAASGPDGGPLAFLSGAAVAQLVSQTVLTGAPVLLALAGGAPHEVTSMFAALALFRAPYVVAVGSVPQLTVRVTQRSLAGEQAALRTLVRSLLVVTVVAAGVAGLVGAWIGPDLLRLVFGDTVEVPAGQAAVMVAGCTVAVANLLLMVVALAEDRPGSSAWAWAVAVAGRGARLRRPVGPGAGRGVDRHLPGRRGRGPGGALRRGAARDADYRRSGLTAARNTDDPNGRSRLRSTRRSRPESPISTRSVRGDTSGSRLATVRGSAPQPAACALGHEEGEHRTERVGRAHDLQPGPRDQLGEPGPGVAPVVSRPDVVVRPRPLVRRDRQQHPSTGREDPGQLGHRQRVVLAVLDDVEGADHVERLVGEGQRQWPTRRRPHPGRAPRGTGRGSRAGGPRASTPRSARPRCRRPGCGGAPEERAEAPRAAGRPGRGTTSSPAARATRSPAGWSVHVSPRRAGWPRAAEERLRPSRSRSRSPRLL